MEDLTLNPFFFAHIKPRNNMCVEINHNFKFNSVNIYSNLENLVLWARSEMIGFAIGQVCSWFQVSGAVKIES